MKITNLSRDSNHFANLWMAKIVALIFLPCAFGVSMGATESRGFVVTWVYPAMNSEDGDCGPDGINPRAQQIFETILKTQKRTPQEIKDAFRGFPDEVSPFITNRGVLNGKPVNVYKYPTSEPDPHIKTAMGKNGYGFNLDGKNGPDDFVDIDTGETGVDNQFARVVGCFESFRGTPKARPSYPAAYWLEPADYMQAWVIEVSGVHDWKNDPNVKIGIYRAVEPIVRGLTSEPLADMSFHIDPNPNSWNEFHGHIKNGVLFTDPIENFNMIGDPYSVTDYRFRNARLRMKFLADGKAEVVLGGYYYWKPQYMNFAMGGGKAEGNLSVDIPGLYYAFRRFAELDPDPETGVNRAISAAYKLEAVPAFLIHSNSRNLQSRSF